jgi:hypothetical protein
VKLFTASELLTLDAHGRIVSSVLPIKRKHLTFLSDNYTVILYVQQCISLYIYFICEDRNTAFTEFVTSSVSQLKVLIMFPHKERHIRCLKAVFEFRNGLFAQVTGCVV